MSDNTVLPGVGETYASDEIKVTDDAVGVNHQEVKLGIGPKGTTTPLSHQDPMPIFAIGLEEILHELRIMNIHLSFITDLHPHPDDGQ